MNPGMDAIYILSPQPHIVDCLMADLEARRYRKFFLLWTTLLDPEMRRRIDNSQSWQACAGGFDTLSIDYYPCESHLITFRDSSTFPILYHPACNNLVRDHMQLLAQKVLVLSLSRNPTLTIADHGRLCDARRKPQDSILSASESDTRSQCPMLTSGQVRARRTGCIRRIQSGFSAAF